MQYISLLEHLEYIEEHYHDFRQEYSNAYGDFDKMVSVVNLYFDVLTDPFNIYINKHTLFNIITLLKKLVHGINHPIFTELLIKYEVYMSHTHPHNIENEYMNFVEDNKYYNMIYVEDIIID